MKRRSLGLALLVLATLYLMVALLVGLFMGMSEDHSLVSVHSHLGLLGWTTMAITGIVYLVLPVCGRSRLAKVHFWLHNIGLPIMMVALSVLALSGDARAKPAVGLGSFIVLAALAVFGVNVLKNGRVEGTPTPVAPARS